jgi:hypothetical protein
MDRGGDELIGWSIDGVAAGCSAPRSGPACCCLGWPGEAVVAAPIAGLLALGRAAPGAARAAALSRLPEAVVRLCGPRQVAADARTSDVLELDRRARARAAGARRPASEPADRQPGGAIVRAATAADPGRACPADRPSSGAAAKSAAARSSNLRSMPPRPSARRLASFAEASPNRPGSGRRSPPRPCRRRVGSVGRPPRCRRQSRAAWRTPLRTGRPATGREAKRLRPADREAGAVPLAVKRERVPLHRLPFAKKNPVAVLSRALQKQRRRTLA